jgi:hypothetical protein
MVLLFGRERLLQKSVVCRPETWRLPESAIHRAKAIDTSLNGVTTCRPNGRIAGRCCSSQSLRMVPLVGCNSDVDRGRATPNRDWAAAPRAALAVRLGFRGPCQRANHAID